MTLTTPSRGSDITRCSLFSEEDRTLCMESPEFQLLPTNYFLTLTLRRKKQVHPYAKCSLGAVSLALAVTFRILGLLTSTCVYRTIREHGPEFGNKRTQVCLSLSFGWYCPHALGQPHCSSKHLRPPLCNKQLCVTLRKT